MKRTTVAETILRPCAEVFDLVHDYGRRLEWDTLLRKACLLDGAGSAGPGVRSLCAGKWPSFGIPMVTEYVTFRRGEVAAVKLVNRPPFFRAFAATIRHAPLGTGRSRIEYIYRFEAKPRWLAWLLEPVMNLRLKRETAKRLKALKDYLERPPRS
ncbi:MAG TPA: SRPBCC family protein [bacterium]|nr:SRPBCC family protein [bacterium]